MPPKSPDSQSPPPMPNPSDLTEAEWAILKVVWDKQPCAAGDVQEALQDTRAWAYSTVKTMMNRMVAKGLLASHRVRNLQLFSACIQPAQAREGEFRRMLKRAFDGAVAPMMQFLIEGEALTKAEIDELRRRIDQHRGKRS